MVPSIRPRLIRLLLFLGWSVLSVGCASRQEDNLQDALAELDRAIAERPALEAAKLARINSMKLACFRAGTYENRIPLARQIVDEYIQYNMDSTRTWIMHWRDWAEAAHLDHEVLWADVCLGELLSNSGFYMEAYDVLKKEVNASRLPDEIAAAYFHAMYRLADNIEENTLLEEGSIPIRHKSVYADSLLTIYDRSSPQWRQFQVNRLMDQRAFRQAKRENGILLDQLDRDSKEYALAAFYESVLCDSLGLDAERMRWEIASARADFKSVIKNYAGLTLVASSLMKTDIDRSFHYIQTSLSDAVFYNAKLRPWQISRYLIDIQEAYEARMREANRKLSVFSWIMAMFAALLVAATVALSLSIRKVNRARREMEAVNLRLQEANGIKENYISLFLSQLSEKIGKIKSLESKVIKQLRYGKGDQLLKEMIASTAVEEETDAFYDTFDTTFLAMYPDFVDQFNDLLEENARIYPKKGEKLNTELRIFALMRLGIEDSNRIADLLKYSVRTIYNYKVKIRNSARVSRAEFDEKIRIIG